MSKLIPDFKDWDCQHMNMGGGETHESPTGLPERLQEMNGHRGRICHFPQ